MKMKNLAVCCLSVFMILGMSACESETKTWETRTQPAVSIHDPSIISIKNQEGETEYYVFGSHIAEAKTKDLINWEVPFTVEYENPEANILYGDIQKTLEKSFEWAGYNDGDHTGYAIWAPDVIWNPDYKWKNGKKGAYMLFYSASSTWRRSCIGFVVSRNIEGPYQTGETVVYSGFSEIDSTDGSTRNINYNNTHLKELIDNGIIEGFSENWVKDNGATYNTDYAPNAIDPTLFYDKEGKLWMTYGSWSGGIYILELNPETGLPLYPGKDSQTEDGRVIDRYFGTKLAGGFHQSGEGPYIVYDEEAGYYYLYITYGGLTAKGGYNMRLFRSENPTGPYVDAKGNVPIFGKNVKNTNFGIKVMGNYQLDCLSTAYMAPGHNSALIDENGERYLVYHTRFNTGAENHEVRVHQMFLNQEGWPVTAVYAYSGDKMSETGYQTDEVTGNYQFIDHGIEYSGEIEPTWGITLHEDGTISGEKTGTWVLEDNRYITLTIDGISYNGVVFRQKDETAGNPQEVMTFTAVGEDNHSIWGSKVDYTEEEFIKRAMKNTDLSALTRKDLDLPREAAFGVKIGWRSQSPEWISDEGKLLKKPSESIKITLTATFTCGAVSETKDYTTKITP